MPGLDKTMGAIPAGGTRRVYGKAHWDGSRWYAVVGENLLDCRWAASVHPRPGLNLIIDISDDGRGQSSAVVMDSYEDQPRPTTGTVTGIVPAGTSWRITFNGDDGKPYSTDRFIGSYDVGDPVDIRWDGTTAIVQGKIQAIAPPQFMPLPPKPTPTPLGTTALIAATTDTRAEGQWGKVGQRAENIYAGRESTSGRIRGFWFYGNPAPVLAGKTITRIRFRLPTRFLGGATETVTLYPHTQPSRPFGEVTVNKAGPSLTLNAIPGNPTWHDLPLTFAETLRNGGGIAVISENVVGYTSRLTDPESGKILIDWSI